MSGKTCTRLASDLYRERTAAMQPVSLRRKKCACGQVVTAKQLMQYGKCSTCVRAAIATGTEEAA